MPAVKSACGTGVRIEIRTGATGAFLPSDDLASSGVRAAGSTSSAIRQPAAVVLHPLSTDVDAEALVTFAADIAPEVAAEPLGSAARLVDCERVDDVEV